MPGSDNETLVVRAVNAIWNRGDLNVADELFGPQYINHHGLITDIVLGPEAIKISAAFYHVAYPGLHVNVDDVRADSKGTVWLRWSVRTSADAASRQEARMPTASQTPLTGFTRIRMANGKIVESWTEWN
jgi:hypothetical protein